MTKSGRYMDRALRSADPRFARILGGLGFRPSEVPKKEPKAAPPKKTVTRADPLDHDRDGRKGGAPKPDAAGGALAALRAEYEEKVGKKPFAGWDGEALKAKIAAHEAAKASTREPAEAGLYDRRDMRASE